MTGGVLQASFADATAALAGRVLGALRGDGDVALANYVDSQADETAALAAVRVVGADVFAPYVLLGRLPNAADIRVVTDSFAVFPPIAAPATPDQWVAAWRDWAMGQMAAHLAGRELDGLSTATPLPDSVAQVLGETGCWQQWSIRAAQLSSMALPPLGGPVTAVVLREATALAMGVTRAMLRRDYLTAARLARWIALLTSMGIELPLDAILLVEHLRLHGGVGSRVLLDLAIARQLLEMEPQA